MKGNIKKYWFISLDLKEREEENMVNNVMVTEGNNAIAVDTGLIRELEKYKGSVKIHPVNGKFDKHGNPYKGIIFHFDDMNGKKDRQAYQAVTEQELWEKRRKFLTNLYYQKQAKKEAAKQVEVVTPISPVVPVYQPTYIQQVPVVTCDKTIAQAIDEFMVDYEPTVSGATIQAETSNNNKIKKYLGDKLVTDITFNDYQSMVNQSSIGEKGDYAAKKTIMNLKTSFNRIMRYCMKQKWISLEDFTLITTDVKIPSYTKVYDNSEKILEYDEIGEVLRALEDSPKYYITSRILLLTGMRQEEFYALEKTDVNRKLKYIDVNKAMTKVKHHKKGQPLFVLGPTKNPQSTRKVPAIEEVFYWFDELEKWMVKSGNRKKAKERGNGNFVITDRNGNLVDEHSFITNLSRYLDDRPDIDYTLGMMRHCYTTHLDDLDANRYDVDVAQGHKLVNVSDKFYRQIRKSYMRRLYPHIEEMAKIINKAYKEK